MAVSSAPGQPGEQLTKVVDLVQAVLGPDLIGVYLYGSAVEGGGLRPHSDLDLFVVSRRRTTHAEKQRLVDGLRPISRLGRRPPSWRPVELTIVVQSELQPWRFPPRVDFQYGEWLHDEFERGNLDPAHESHTDVAVLMTMVLLHGRPLLGPPPAEVLDQVPREHLVQAMVEGIRGLTADLASDTTNVVLTFARMWTTLATGEVRSKDEAAEWALSRLPEEHRPVLRRARDVYLGLETDRWEDLEPRVRPHAEHVLGRIERLASAWRT